MDPLAASIRHDSHLILTSLWPDYDLAFTKNATFTATVTKCPVIKIPAIKESKKGQLKTTDVGQGDRPQVTQG
jgi:hypothetical protein